MKGNVFDIRRFSTHDGDGIRTTVFLKGCPLSCVWCQNPEGISKDVRPLYFENRCIGCKTCVKESICEGVTANKNKIMLHSEAKEDWAHLIDVCPAGALEMDSKEMSVEEVMEEIRKDKAFYCYGNGGVTLSGGEPTFQWKFALEILKACKAEGIHTAIETTLFTDSQVLSQVLPYLDLVYADYKIAENTKHQKYVGVPNDIIKENLKMVLESEHKDKVIIRTPLIPTMTTGEDNIKNIAQYISSIYPEVKYELLNYNPLAEAKYHLVDKEFCFKDNPKMYTKEQMKEFASYATTGGVKNLIIES